MPFLLAKRVIVASSNQVSSDVSPSIVTAPQVTYATTYNFSAIPTPTDAISVGEPHATGTSSGEKGIIIGVVVGAGLIIVVLVVYMTVKRRRQAEYARQLALDGKGYREERASEEAGYHGHSNSANLVAYNQGPVATSPTRSPYHQQVLGSNMASGPYRQALPLPSYAQSQETIGLQVWNQMFVAPPEEDQVRSPDRTVFNPDYKMGDGGPPFQRLNRYTIDSMVAPSVDSAAQHRHKPHYSVYANLLLKKNPYTPSAKSRGRANSVASSKFDHSKANPYLDAYADIVKKNPYASSIQSRRNSISSPADLASQSIHLPPMLGMDMDGKESIKSINMFPKPLAPSKKQSNPTLYWTDEKEAIEMSAVSTPTTVRSRMATQNVNDACRDSSVWHAKYPNAAHAEIAESTMSGPSHREGKQRSTATWASSTQSTLDPVGRGGLATTLQSIDWQSIDWNAKIGSARVSRPESSVYSFQGKDDEWEAQRQRVLGALKSKYWSGVAKACPSSKLNKEASLKEESLSEDRDSRS